MADIASGSDKSLEVFFLQNALTVAPPGEAQFNTHVISPEYIWNSPLSEFQCVFILDALAGYSEPELEGLGDYLGTGGTLVYFSGRETATSIAKLNQGNLSTVRFLGYHGEVNQLRSYSVTNLNQEAPIVFTF